MCSLPLCPPKGLALGAFSVRGQSTSAATQVGTTRFSSSPSAATVHTLRPFILPQGNYTSDAAQFFIDLVTFWILYSYLVPISLFVTMEIVKFWQVRP